MADNRQPASRLQKTLERTQNEIDELDRDADSSLMETRVQIVGLYAKLWSIRARIELDGSSAEMDATRRQIEFENTLARLAKERKADLLPKILTRLDELEGQPQRLRSIPRRVA